MGISNDLAHFVCDTRYEDIPAHVIEVQKQSVLDAIAIIMGASTLGDGCKDFVDFATEMSAGAKGESTVLGFGRKLPMLWAAFANASMAHSLDFGDTYAVGSIHSNSSTFPAALALAEHLGNVTGKQFISALVLGSEVACRLSKVVPPADFVKYGFYMPPVFTSFAATAATGKLLNLSVDEMLSAFSFNLSQYTCSAELTQNADTVLRSVREAFGAKSALSSSLLAKRGLKGFKEPFEGKLGFYHAYFRDAYDPAAVVAGLGSEYEAEKLIFKPWPCCMGNHGCINAALELRQQHKVDPKDIVSIRAEVPSVATVVLEPLEQKRHPQNTINAKFSLPFTVATAMIDGDVSLSSFTADTIRRQDILDLAAKVSYEVRPEWDRDLSANMGGRLTVTTATEEHQVWVKKTIGNPENPMSMQDFEKKLTACAQHAYVPLAPQSLSNMIDAVRNLDSMQNMGELTALLVGAPHGGAAKES